ncbi:MAG TPA: GxxExxY protein [Candidatus Paceibacterota bacterium]|nr:GxxExxY protein [Candidatus Paceibacterota bacterium]
MATIIHKELSYRVNGILFDVHNQLGRFCREKKYGDLFETKLRNEKMVFERERAVAVEEIKREFTNKVDFVISNTLLVDLKAKPIVTKDDYYQMNRYLNACGYDFGLIVNFRNKYLKPIRVIRSIRN